VFDSSYERNEPLRVPLEVVIAGWSEGLRMIKVGGKARLYIPSDLAYGEYGAGDIIGPNAVIVFDVELLDILENYNGE
jgi:FKBP-type peptidyl-prolyl cis-trans isomerase